MSHLLAFIGMLLCVVVLIVGCWIAVLFCHAVSDRCIPRIILAIVLWVLFFACGACWLNITS